MELQAQPTILENKLYSMFSEIAQEFDYPEHTFSIKKNYSKKGKSAGKLISTEININEFSYPYDEENKITKTTLILYVTPKTTCHELMIRKERFDKIPLPTSATILKRPTEKTLYFHVAFKLDDVSIYQYIKNNIMFCIDNYEAHNSFGCCSLYKECSKKQRCLHSNNLYAKGCTYRKNLENGLIFY